MSGELAGDTVVVSDQKEGNQLYNRGNYGYPRRGGGLDLDLAEATYLLESSRIEVSQNGSPLTFEELFNHSSSVLEGFDIKYMVYRDMRQRGFVVKVESGGFDMSVFPRGKTMSDSRPIYMVRAASERTAFDIGTFSGEVSETAAKGKQLLYGVVDEEGDLTYYNMSVRDPRGEAPVLPIEGKAAGRLIRDRVFVFSKEEAERIRAAGFYGKMLNNILQLSIIESCFLMREGALDVVSSETGAAMSSQDLVDFGRASQDEFDIRLRAFEDLRRRGLVVKTGFKYGTHFRVYERSPDDCHARYLVHAVSASNVAMWPEISRTVRLSGGVKKEILFCRVSEGTEYLEFRWFRP
ncbi:MAG: tRNA-intron lyase [Candidatus Methanomethylophilaceae archaeon]|jgi:tRNA-intron endonuclease|nr:tRNA-intron lyase [Candidatus Methanomethylophilaceae archaeon]NLF33350.1 tRNA-intron lyase [Thermoplasmatales archaeon]